MRLILARILFDFDLQLVDEKKDWMDHNFHFFWIKPLLNVYLTPASNRR